MMYMKGLSNLLKASWSKKIAVVLAALAGLAVVSAFASGTPSNFSTFTANISSTEFQILKIVQVVVTLAGILLVLRGVVHLKQHAHGSPQEKHLPKGIANIVFAALLFMVVPLLHMFVGSLTSGIGSNGNNWTVGSAGYAGGLATQSAAKSK